MCRKAQVADVGALGEARHDHIPAEQALRSAEREQADHLPAVAPWNAALPRQPSQAASEYDSDQPPKQAMDEFPPVDVLELGEGHPSGSIDLAVFGGRLIEVESVGPVGLAQRRDDAAERFPFGD